MIYGIGTPGKIRQAGTMYTDKRTGTVYIQNASPSGNEWSMIDGNVTDDSLGGSGGVFTGGTVTGAVNFISTVSIGGTNINSIFAASVHTHVISDVTNLQSNLNTKVNKSGDTMTGGLTTTSLSATSLSGGTILSGGTNIGNLFARTTHTHSISDVTNLTTELGLKADLNSPIFSGSLQAGTNGELIPVNVFGTLSATTLNVFGIKGKIKTISDDYIVDSDNSLEPDFTIISEDNRNVNITLPNAVIGRILVIINGFTKASSDTIISGDGKTIDGLSSITLTGIRKSCVLQYNRSEWFVLSIRG